MTAILFLGHDDIALRLAGGTGLNAHQIKQFVQPRVVGREGRSDQINGVDILSQGHQHLAQGLSQPIFGQGELGWIDARRGFVLEDRGWIGLQCLRGDGFGGRRDVHDLFGGVAGRHCFQQAVQGDGDAPRFARGLDQQRGFERCEIC